MSDSGSAVKVLPGVGLVTARFGEERSLHRQRLGGFQSFERTPGAGVTDLYADGLIMLSYDGADRLNFIEISGRTEVVWDDVELTGRPLSSVLDSLESKGIRAVFDGDAVFECSVLGIDLFTSAPDEPDQPVEGVSVHPVGSD